MRNWVYLYALHAKPSQCAGNFPWPATVAGLMQRRAANPHPVAEATGYVMRSPLKRATEPAKAGFVPTEPEASAPRRATLHQSWRP